MIGRMMNHAKETTVDSMGDLAPTFSPKHAGESPLARLDYGTPVSLRYDQTDIKDLPSRIARYIDDVEVLPDDEGVRLVPIGTLLNGGNVVELHGPNGERCDGGATLILGMVTGELDINGFPIVAHVGPVNAEQFIVRQNLRALNSLGNMNIREIEGEED